MYSAFAGFMEPGETLEEAVKRELQEEVSLAVSSVRYHASQPWPFPSSLMLGCYAEALSKDFRVDAQEIEQACWMTKSEVRARLAGEIQDGIKLPGTIAIARTLLADWARTP
jgi:NAD+ diphosphatase